MSLLLYAALATSSANSTILPSVALSRCLMDFQFLLRFLRCTDVCGFFISIPNVFDAYTRSDFRRLHLRHNNRVFCSDTEPPWTRGTSSSKCRSSVESHRTQRPLSRRQIALFIADMGGGRPSSVGDSGIGAMI